MVDMPKCCRPDHDIKKCIKMIEEGIEAQCTGLEDLKRRDIRAGKEHIIWGLRKVEEGLCCLEKR